MVIGQDDFLVCIYANDMSIFSLIHNRGQLDWEMVLSYSYEQLPDFQGSTIGPFQGLEALENFALGLSRTVRASGVRFLTTEEFNFFIKDLSSIDEFFIQISRHGSWKDTNFTQERSGLLGRVFG